MDDLQYAEPVMDRTLHELEIINRWLGGNAVTLNALSAMVKPLNPTSLSIADVGCGRGDMLLHIRQWAQSRNIAVTLTGIDANPYVVEAARNHLSGITGIDLKTMNIFSDDFGRQRYDIAIGTLFYHHFSDDELVATFRQLAGMCRIGFIVNDIHRHPVAYYGIRFLTRLFSRSAMVRYDAPLSVLRAFSRSDLHTILTAAGVTRFTLRWRWAFRWEVIAYV